MKKIVFILVLLLGVSLSDGYTEHNKGNKQKASELYKNACDAGDMRGCSSLGFLYSNGDGVKPPSTFRSPQRPFQDGIVHCLRCFAWFYLISRRNKDIYIQCTHFLNYL